MFNANVTTLELSQLTTPPTMINTQFNQSTMSVAEQRFDRYNPMNRMPTAGDLRVRMKLGINERRRSLSYSNCFLKVGHQHNEVFKKDIKVIDNLFYGESLLTSNAKEINGVDEPPVNNQITQLRPNVQKITEEQKLLQKIPQDIIVTLVEPTSGNTKANNSPNYQKDDMADFDNKNCKKRYGSVKSKIYSKKAQMQMLQNYKNITENDTDSVFTITKVRNKLKVTTLTYQRIVNIGFAKSPKGTVYKCFMLNCAFQSYNMDVFRYHVVSFHDNDQSKLKYICGICEQVLALETLEEEFNHMINCHLNGTQQLLLNDTTNKTHSITDNSKETVNIDLVEKIREKDSITLTLPNTISKIIEIDIDAENNDNNVDNNDNNVDNNAVKMNEKTINQQSQMLEFVEGTSTKIKVKSIKCQDCGIFTHKICNQNNVNEIWKCDECKNKMNDEPKELTTDDLLEILSPSIKQRDGHKTKVAMKKNSDELRQSRRVSRDVENKRKRNKRSESPKIKVTDEIKKKKLSTKNPEKERSRNKHSKRKKREEIARITEDTKLVLSIPLKTLEKVDKIELKLNSSTKDDAEVDSDQIDPSKSAKIKVFAETKKKKSSTKKHEKLRTRKKAKKRENSTRIIEDTKIVLPKPEESKPVKVDQVEKVDKMELELNSSNVTNPELSQLTRPRTMSSTQFNQSTISVAEQRFDRYNPLNRMPTAGDLKIRTRLGLNERRNSLSYSNCFLKNDHQNKKVSKTDNKVIEKLINGRSLSTSNAKEIKSVDELNSSVKDDAAVVKVDLDSNQIDPSKSDKIKVIDKIYKKLSTIKPEKLRTRNEHNKAKKRENSTRITEDTKMDLFKPEKPKPVIADKVEKVDKIELELNSSNVTTPELSQLTIPRTMSSTQFNQSTISVAEQRFDRYNPLKRMPTASDLKIRTRLGLNERRNSLSYSNCFLKNDHQNKKVSKTDNKVIEKLINGRSLSTSNAKEIKGVELNSSAKVEEVMKVDTDSNQINLSKSANIKVIDEIKKKKLCTIKPDKVRTPIKNIEPKKRENSTRITEDTKMDLFKPEKPKPVIADKVEKVDKIELELNSSNVTNPELSQLTRPRTMSNTQFNQSTISVAEQRFDRYNPLNRMPTASDLKIRTRLGLNERRNSLSYSNCFLKNDHQNKKVSKTGNKVIEKLINGRSLSTSNAKEIKGVQLNSSAKNEEVMKVDTDSNQINLSKSANIKVIDEIKKKKICTIKPDKVRTPIKNIEPKKRKNSTRITEDTKMDLFKPEKPKPVIVDKVEKVDKIELELNSSNVTNPELSQLTRPRTMSSTQFNQSTISVAEQRFDRYNPLNRMPTASDLKIRTRLGLNERRNSLSYSNCFLKNDHQNKKVSKTDNKVIEKLINGRSLSTSNAKEIKGVELNSSAKVEEVMKVDTDSNQINLSKSANIKVIDEIKKKKLCTIKPDKVRTPIKNIEPKKRENSTRITEDTKMDLFKPEKPKPVIVDKVEKVDKIELELNSSNVTNPELSQLTIPRTMSSTQFNQSTISVAEQRFDRYNPLNRMPTASDLKIRTRLGLNERRNSLSYSNCFLKNDHQNKKVSKTDNKVIENLINGRSLSTSNAKEIKGVELNSSAKVEEVMKVDTDSNQINLSKSANIKVIDEIKKKKLCTIKPDKVRTPIKNIEPKKRENSTRITEDTKMDLFKPEKPKPVIVDKVEKVDKIELEQNSSKVTNPELSQLTRPRTMSSTQFNQSTISVAEQRFDKYNPLNRMPTASDLKIRTRLGLNERRNSLSYSNCFLKNDHQNKKVSKTDNKVIEKLINGRSLSTSNAKAIKGVELNSSAKVEEVMKVDTDSNQINLSKSANIKVIDEIKKKKLCTIKPDKVRTPIKNIEPKKRENGTRITEDTKMDLFKPEKPKPVIVDKVEKVDKIELELNSSNVTNPELSQLTIPRTMSSTQFNQSTISVAEQRFDRYNPLNRMPTASDLKIRTRLGLNERRNSLSYSNCFLKNDHQNKKVSKTDNKVIEKLINGRSLSTSNAKEIKGVELNSSAKVEEVMKVDTDSNQINLSKSANIKVIDEIKKKKLCTIKPDKVRTPIKNIEPKKRENGTRITEDTKMDLFNPEKPKPVIVDKVEKVDKIELELNSSKVTNPELSQLTRPRTMSNTQFNQSTISVAEQRFDRYNPLNRMPTASDLKIRTRLGLNERRNSLSYSNCFLKNDHQNKKVSKTDNKVIEKLINGRSLSTSNAKEINGVDEINSSAKDEEVMKVDLNSDQIDPSKSAKINVIDEIEKKKLCTVKPDKIRASIKKKKREECAIATEYTKIVLSKPEEPKPIIVDQVEKVDKIELELNSSAKDNVEIIKVDLNTDQIDLRKSAKIKVIDEIKNKKPSTKKPEKVRTRNEHNTAKRENSTRTTECAQIVLSKPEEPKPIIVDQVEKVDKMELELNSSAKDNVEIMKVDLNTDQIDPSKSAKINVIDEIEKKKLCTIKPDKIRASIKKKKREECAIATEYTKIVLSNPEEPKPIIVYQVEKVDKMELELNSSAKDNVEIMKVDLNTDQIDPSKSAKINDIDKIKEKKLCTIKPDKVRTPIKNIEPKNRENSTRITEDTKIVLSKPEEPKPVDQVEKVEKMGLEINSSNVTTPELSQLTRPRTMINTQFNQSTISVAKQRFDRYNPLNRMPTAGDLKIRTRLGLNERRNSLDYSNCFLKVDHQDKEVFKNDNKILKKLLFGRTLSTSNAKEINGVELNSSAKDDAHMKVYLNSDQIDPSKSAKINDIDKIKEKKLCTIKPDKVKTPIKNIEPKNRENSTRITEDTKIVLSKPEEPKPVIVDQVEKVDKVEKVKKMELELNSSNVTTPELSQLTRPQTMINTQFNQSTISVAEQRFDRYNPLNPMPTEGDLKIQTRLGIKILEKLIYRRSLSTSNAKEINGVELNSSAKDEEVMKVDLDSNQINLSKSAKINDIDKIKEKKLCTIIPDKVRTPIKNIEPKNRENSTRITEDTKIVLSKPEEPKPIIVDQVEKVDEMELELNSSAKNASSLEDLKVVLDADQIDLNSIDWSKYKILKIVDSIPEVHTFLNHISMQPWVKTRPNLKSSSGCVSMMEKNALISTFKCMGKMCSYYTSNETLFYSHLTLHSEKKQDSLFDFFLFCSYCCFEANKIESLIQHVMIKHGRNKYQCPFCFYRCLEPQSCTLHLKSYHNEKPHIIYECPGEIVQRDVNILNIRLLKNREIFVLPVKCSICTKPFYTFQEYVSHVKNHSFYGANKEILEKRLYRDLATLHILVENKQFGLFHCLFCLFGTDIEDEVRLHFSVAHPHEPAYVCKRESTDLKCDRDETIFNSTKIFHLLNCVTLPIEKFSGDIKVLDNDDKWREIVHVSKDEIPKGNETLAHSELAQSSCFEYYTSILPIR